MKNAIIIFISCLLFACHSSNKRIEKALNLSGNNRGELEKVLLYYSQNPRDSLKLKATHFLVSNMPKHMSLDSNQLVALHHQIEKFLNNSTTEDSIKHAIAHYRLNNDAVYQDIERINAEYLIKNIEYAFEIWERTPWHQQFTFDEFCEYVLPYKYAEYQVLDDWRDTLANKYNRKMNSLIENDETSSSIYHIGKLINREINEKINVNLADVKLKFGSSFYTASLLYRLPFGDCDEYTSLILATMRSLGVPAMTDFIPQWGHLPSGGHRWVVLLNNDGRHLPIPHIHQNPGDVFFPMHKIPKVYRSVYSVVPERERYVENAAYVYDQQTLFHKDVTSEYVPVTDLVVPISDTKIKDDYAYISCFSYGYWNIVDFGKIKSGKACFYQMGRNVVYLIMGYNGEDLIPISEPFLLDNQGRINLFKPNEDSLRTITIRRKYPRKEQTAVMENRMLDCRIQATNEDMEYWATYYWIEDQNYPDRIAIHAPKKYRYWRFIGGHSFFMNLAEFQLLCRDSEQPITGKIIGSEHIYKNNPEWSHEKAFDGDWLTFFHASNEDTEQWVGLDLGEPKQVDYVRCVARSDDNGIHYGDLYELVYWSDGKWHSLGQQIASERFLTFECVPDNALLLLRNLTRGKEERIFIYRDNMQSWL